MKNFSIPEPCSENWNEMTPTQKGAFCQKCALEVHDVSDMTNRQIRGLFHENLGKRTCVRMTLEQEASMNDDFTQWQQSNKVNIQRAMVFSLLVVFGLSLFSCNNPQQVKELQDLQSIAASVIPLSENADAIEKSSAFETKETTKETVLVPKETVQHDFRLGQMIDMSSMERHTKGEVVYNPDLDVVQLSHQYRTAGVPVMIEDYEAFIFDEITLPIEAQFELDKRVSELTFSAIAFPNPVITDTRLEVTIPEDTKHLEITLMDLNGKVLKKVSNTKAEAGTHHFEIGMQELKPAIYLVDVRYNKAHEVVRIVKAN